MWIILFQAHEHGLCAVPFFSTEFGYYSMWRFCAYLLSGYVIHIHCIDVAKCPNNVLAGHEIVHYFTDRVTWLHLYILNIYCKKNRTFLAPLWLGVWGVMYGSVRIFFIPESTGNAPYFFLELEFQHVPNVHLEIPTSYEITFVLAHIWTNIL